MIRRIFFTWLTPPVEVVHFFIKDGKKHSKPTMELSYEPNRCSPSRRKRRRKAFRTLQMDATIGWIARDTIVVILMFGCCCGITRIQCFDVQRRSLTAPKGWTSPQRDMMISASMYDMNINNNRGTNDNRMPSSASTMAWSTTNLPVSPNYRLNPVSPSSLSTSNSRSTGTTFIKSGNVGTGSSTRRTTTPPPRPQSQIQKRKRQKMRPMPILGYSARTILAYYDSRPLEVGWRLNSLGLPLLGTYNFPPLVRTVRIHLS